jgi:acetate kinase
VRVLCLNAGSSSLKWASFDGPKAVLSGAVEGNDAEALAAVFRAWDRAGLPPPDAAGHRVVHGGPDHHLPERVTPALIEALRSVVPFAPLHLPAAIAGMEALSARLPWLPQVACYDTAFHWNLPEVTRRFPLPERIAQAGIRRYGFHGLSYEYIVSAATLPRRTVIAHLGNGSSMVALVDGRPVDTTMGLTPMGGLMMGTRPGDLDPGVLLFLLRSGQPVDGLDSLLERESGLLGVSGETSDMRALLEARATDARAALAVEMFCYHARKSIGALAAVLGGLDALVFTGGIGENAPAVREEICSGLAHLGIPVVKVIPTNEDAVIARHTRTLLSSGSSAM